MHDRREIYVDGAWVSPGSEEKIEVENPFTEEVLATVPAGTSADVARAVAAARAAFPEWSRTSTGQRADLLRRVQDGLAKRADEIAETISTEMGCPLRISGN